MNSTLGGKGPLNVIIKLAIIQRSPMVAMGIHDQYLTSNVGSEQIWLKHQTAYPDWACMTSNQTIHHFASKFKERCLHNEQNINQNKCQRTGCNKNKRWEKDI